MEGEITAYELHELVEAKAESLGRVVVLLPSGKKLHSLDSTMTLSTLLQL